MNAKEICIQSGFCLVTPGYADIQNRRKQSANTRKSTKKTNKRYIHTRPNQSMCNAIAPHSMICEESSEMG